MSETNLLAPNTKYNKRVLRVGMKGDDVKYMQGVLSDLNDFYKFCPTKNLQDSGYFGNETQKMVKFFQYWVGLNDWAGYFERNTCNAMEKKYVIYMEASAMADLFARTEKAFDDAINKPDPFDKY